jgi:L-ascorbate metabolism protein UlaG (beta-lactamase superfamily)
MKIQYFGHSCFMLYFAGKKILLDPFISGNPKAQHISIDALNPDYIFLSHGHMDHLKDLEEIAKASQAPVITSFDIMTKFLEPKGIGGHGMNIGGKLSLEGFTFKIVTAVHSSMLPDQTYGGNPMGFVFWNEETCFYYSGDTALTLDMKLIPLTCPKLDFAILSMGDYFTMGYEDALIAADFIQCDKIVGCHYDSFPPIQIDHQAAKAAFRSKGKTLNLPEVGETFEV